MCGRGEALEMTTILVRRAGICCHELDGEAVLYDPAHHALHYLNATAYLIWQQCDGGCDVRTILDGLADQLAYDGTAEDLREEIMAAVSRLTGNGLLDRGQLQAA